MGAATTIGSVISADGTRISYRQVGDGPGLVLLHGALMSAANFDRLAAALAPRFTVTVPDRRGRGISGPHGDGYGMDREIEDLGAVLDATDSRNVFGLSSGALICLRAAFELPRLRRVALYEPPLPIDGERPDAWAPRFERELAAGQAGAAFLTLVRGTGDSLAMRLLPRALLAPVLSIGLRLQAREVHGRAGTAVRDLLPTVRYDLRLVAGADGVPVGARKLDTDVLLLDGVRSPRHLRRITDRLAGELPPSTQRVTLPGVGHLAADNDGRPGLVAAELDRFFAP